MIQAFIAIRLPNLSFCAEYCHPLVSFLKKRGFECFVSGNLIELTGDLTRQKNDKSRKMIIISIDLPIVDGFDSIKAIKKNEDWKNIPIIALSKKISDAEKAIEVGADGFMLEPCSEEECSFIGVFDNIEKKEQTKKNGFKILSADDHLDSQLVIGRFLKNKGFKNVVFVSNGKAAVEAARNGSFGLILMNINMPKMRGDDAIREIRTFDGYKEIPIIAITASVMVDNRRKCMEAGASDYVAKPINFSIFSEKLDFVYSNRVFS